MSRRPKPFPPLWAKRLEEQRREALGMRPSKETMRLALALAAEREGLPAHAAAKSLADKVRAIRRRRAEASAASKATSPATLRAQAIRDMHDAHPTWLRSSIAREFGVSVGVVNAALSKPRRT